MQLLRRSTFQSTEKFLILFCFIALKINQLKYYHLITDAMLKHDGYCISEICISEICISEICISEIYISDLICISENCISEIQYQQATRIQMRVCVELSHSLIVILDLLFTLIPPQRAILNLDNTTIQNRFCSYAT